MLTQAASAFNGSLANANPQSARPQEHSLLRQEVFLTTRATFGGHENECLQLVSQKRLAEFNVFWLDSAADQISPHKP